MAKIVGIDDNSILLELGVEIGDEILGFNGEPMEDIIDYDYYDGQNSFTINMRSKQGDIVDLEIEKLDTETMGVTLDDSVYLTPIRCKNKCAFCFVDQLPKGLRETLYVKDDDYRMSFVCGNFVTLTNVYEKELNRIVKYHLSPLYISVHALSDDIVVKLIKNPEAKKTMSKIEFLAKNGISMHTQIVMCKGYNDGEELQRTMEKLFTFYPKVKTLAIVPVGLTEYRDDVQSLAQIDKETARKTIEQVNAFNKKNKVNFALCSDEFYIKADMDLPDASFYGDFPQIENGVGLCRVFMDGIVEAVTKHSLDDKEIEIGLITGQSFKAYLKKACDIMNKKFPNVKFKIYDIINNFFGKTITVAGLITGKDIVAQVKNPPKNIIIPSTMLREFTDTMLDGMTVKELEEKLGSKIWVNSGAEDLVRIVGEIK